MKTSATYTKPSLTPSSNGRRADRGYFWTSDQVIVPEPGLKVMTAAIRELVRSGDLFRVGTRSVS